MLVQNIKFIKLFVIILSLYFSGSFLHVDAREDSGVTAFENENIRGLIKPRKTAVISSEIILAKIIRMPFKEGDRFNKGDILVEFDCAMNHANLAAAKAEHEARSKKHENNKELLALDAISNIEVELSAADVKKAVAEVQVANIRVQHCLVKAPYDGRVVTTWANEFESVETDIDLLSILNDKELEIELIIPSNWLGWLKEGEHFDFLVDETGKKYSATISRIGAAVDATSQTIRVIGIFESTNKDILSGMSGTAAFKYSPNPAD